jgi:hypothetical protein
MRVSAILTSAALLLTLPASASVRPRHKSGHGTVNHASVKKTFHIQGMAPERATEIQQALIKQGYLSGEPTGVWDAQSVAAMQKLQGDNGWQTKITPDSRALIKLGLGGGSNSATAMASTSSAFSAQ